MSLFFSRLPTLPLASLSSLFPCDSSSLFPYTAGQPKKGSSGKREETQPSEFSLSLPSLGFLRPPAPVPSPLPPSLDPCLSLSISLLPSLTRGVRTRLPDALQREQHAAERGLNDSVVDDAQAE